MDFDKKILEEKSVAQKQLITFWKSCESVFFNYVESKLTSEIVYIK